jgi:hypothetical protein
MSTKQPLQVWVDIPAEENTSLLQFFSFRGMKKAFLDEYPKQKRKDLDRALSHATFKLDLIKDVRQFVEDHKAEVQDFLQQPTTAA